MKEEIYCDIGLVIKEEIDEDIVIKTEKSHQVSIKDESVIEIGMKKEPNHDGIDIKKEDEYNDIHMEKVAHDYFNIKQETNDFNVKDDYGDLEISDGDVSIKEEELNFSSFKNLESALCTENIGPKKVQESAERILATLKNELDLILKNGERKLAILQAELMKTTFKREDNVFQCFMCDYKTKREILAKTHALIHCDTKIFNCSECDYGTSNKYRFKQHFRQHFKRHMSQFSVHRDISNKEKDSSEEQWSRNISNSQRDSEDVHTTSKYNSATDTKCCAEENSQINSDDRLQYTKFDFESNEKDQLDLNKHNSKLFTCLKCNFKTSVEVLNRHKLKHWSKFKCLRCDYITDCHIHLSAASSSKENEARGYFLTNDVKEPNSDDNIENNQEIIRSCFSDSNDTASENISSPENIQKISDEQYMEILSPAIKDVRDQIFGLTIRVVGDTFQCFQCTFKTKHKGNAKKHALAHSGVKLFKSRVCDFGTNRAVNLKRHLDAHRISSPSEKPQKCNSSPYKRKDNTNETDIDTSSSLACYKEKLSCKSNFSVCKRMKKDKTVTDSLTFANLTKDILNNSGLPSDNRMPEFATDIRVPFSSPENVSSYKSSFPTCSKMEQEHKKETVDTLLFASSEKESPCKAYSSIGRRKRQENENANSSCLFSKKIRQENEEDGFDLQAQLLSSVVRHGYCSWVCSICNLTTMDSCRAKSHAMTHFPERVSKLFKSGFNVKNGKFECLICLYSTRIRYIAKCHILTHFKRNVDEDKTNEKKHIQDRS